VGGEQEQARVNLVHQCGFGRAVSDTGSWVEDWCA
jgi:hypothetical protein